MKDGAMKKGMIGEEERRVGHHVGVLGQGLQIWAYTRLSGLIMV